MNSTGRLDNLYEAVLKNVISFSLVFIILCINGAFVFAYFKNQDFRRDPRYVLYIHLVMNDMIMLAGSLVLQIASYVSALSRTSCCLLLLLLLTANKNSPLNLAGMAVERYIAICRPLHHVHICTVQRAHALIALIWVVSFIPAVVDVFIVLATKPLSFFSTVVVCYHANMYNTKYHKVHVAVVEALLFSFVFFTVIVTYLKVLCTARAVAGSDRSAARSAHNTILLHGVQLFLCMLTFIAPFITLPLVTAWPQDRTEILFTSFLFTNVFPRLLSPLIYGVRDKKFRTQIRLLFCTIEKRAEPAAGSQRRSRQESH